MIRINLAKNFKVGAVTSVNQGESTEVESYSVEGFQRKGILNLIIILLIPAVMYIYEMETIPAKASELISHQALLAELIEKNEKAKNAVTETNKFKEDQIKIESQISIIENLKKGRMQLVRVLDSIQRVIPTKVWLSKLEINMNGGMIIQGFSMTDNALTSFMESLSRSIFLKDVNLIKSTEQLDESGASVKQFDIGCILEQVQ